MLKSLFENMLCVTSEDSKEQEERELYEVAANYDDFGIGGSAKKLADDGLDLAQVMELNRLVQAVDSTAGPLDGY